MKGRRVRHAVAHASNLKLALQEQEQSRRVGGPMADGCFYPSTDSLSGEAVDRTAGSDSACRF
jgi:hypothetical protein